MNNFYYDPQKQGYDTTAWQTISGTPAVTANQLVLNNATVISQADFYSGEITLGVICPVAPIAGQDKRFGLAQLNRGAFVGFRITDAKLYYESEGGSTAFTPIEITWDSDWTAVATDFKIVWNNFNVEFWIGARKIAILNTGFTPNIPLGVYIKNADADDLKVMYMQVRNANVWSPSNHVEISLDASQVEIGSVDVLPPDTMTAGEKVVTTSGTAVALGTTIATKSIYIRAKTTNTGVVYVGDSSVDATTSKQMMLNASGAIALDIANRSSVYVDADVNGEGVDYLAFS